MHTKIIWMCNQNEILRTIENRIQHTEDIQRLAGIPVVPV